MSTQSFDDDLTRLFTMPEAPESTLSQIEADISANLLGFLNDNIAAVEKPLEQVEADFRTSKIPESGRLICDYATEVMASLVSHSVHTAAPTFIGHMTSSLPNFLLPFSKLMVGLNQNLVKIETSKAFTPLERQVLGMLHHLVYGEDEAFYKNSMHDEGKSLGAFCSGGTVANITALWIARNILLKPDGDFKGVGQSGVIAGMLHYGYKGMAVMVSQRAHYSLGKAADLLGIGREHFVAVECDENNRVKVPVMAEKAQELEAQGIKVMAIVGIAGTTETGHIDDLTALGELAQQLGCYFHVDAAWGGATLFSNKHRVELAGIELADSVTIDAHKQMYVPMGAGMVLFKQPSLVQAIEHHAEYILRKGSKDLGSHTLEGSRPGMALLVHACFHIIGREGYERLIDRSIAKAKLFADLIEQHEDFQLVSKPQLCILTYRYVPKSIQRLLSDNISDELRADIYQALNKLTASIQKRQRELGKSFVSRTRLTPVSYQNQPTVVFRVVLANPLTDTSVLHDVLKQQMQLANDDMVFQQFLKSLLPKV